MKDEGEANGAPTTLKRYPLSQLQMHKKFKVVDQEVKPPVEGQPIEPLEEDNVDANIFPQFFESVFPSAESIARMMQERKDKKDKKKSSKRKAKAILSGSDVIFLTLRLGLMWILILI